MKKKILYITSLVLILLAAASTWSYYCLDPSSDRVNKAKANIKVYSHYELIQNGKSSLINSLFLAITTSSYIIIIMSSSY